MRAQFFRVSFDNRTEIYSKHVVEIKLEICLPSHCALITKSPFAAGMRGRDPVHCVASAFADCRQKIFDLWSFLLHSGEISGTYVVHVDINGQSWNIEDKEVERRSALKHQAILEELVLTYL